MTNGNSNDTNRLLMRLKECLDVYSATLVDWRQTMDEASVEISQLSPKQAHELADEIDEMRKSHSEYIVLKARVDAGWALYRTLSRETEYGNASHHSDALWRSAQLLN